MEMKLVSIEIKNFKGIKEETINLNQTTDISGMNGVGKTTIADAYYWVISDKNYALRSKPEIFPIDVEECSPSVTLKCDIDGKPVELRKFQKRTVSKPNADGISKVTTTNSYEINAVPKSETAFKEYLTDLGIDFDNILPLSHPDVFTGNKADEMRKVLFSMVSDITDSDIAKTMDNVKDLAELLENYSLEEIKAIQKSTLRKILENYGKHGEILNAQIEGLESAKVEVDGKSFVQKAEEIKLAISNYEAQVSELNKQIMDKMNPPKPENSALLEKLHNKKIMLQQQIQSNELKLLSTNKDLEQSERDLKEEGNRYKQLVAQKFDDTQKVCPCCGQALPMDNIEEMKRKFEEKKQVDVSQSIEKGKLIKRKVTTKTTEVKKIKNDHSKLESELKDILTKISEEEAKIPESVIPDVSKEKEEIAKINSQIYLERENLISVERQLSSVDNNYRIDKQIEELRKKQMEYEQSKADAEKILYQADLLGKAKNEKLSDSINSNFEIVKFQLFDYLKNGDIKDVCIPLIDGKRFGESTNTGREILAKLDIVKGLQKYYGKVYPVFLDKAESLSSISRDRINMDSQIIYLTVSEKEGLNVE